MSSYPPVVPQHCSNVPLLFELLKGEEEISRIWLRSEMNQIADPLIDSLFHGLIISSSSSAVPQSRSTVSELCQQLDGQKVETRMVLRGEMDRVVNTLFERLTNKLKTYEDWHRSEDAGDRAQVGNLLGQVESHNAQSHQVKREIEEENEMEFKNVMDKATQTNEQIEDCVKREIKVEFEDGEMMEIKKEEDEEDGETQINDIEDLTDDNQSGDDDGSRSEENGPMDWVKQEIKEEEEDGEMLDIGQEEEEEEEEGETGEVDLGNANEGDEADEVSLNVPNATDIDTLFDRSMRDEFALQLAANEGANEESSSVDDSQIGTTPAHLIRQSQANKMKSARHDKRKLKVPQARNEGNDQDNQHVNDVEKGQIDEVSSRRVKRPRMDTTQANNAQAEVTRHYPRQATDEVQSNQDRPHEEGDRMESGHEPTGEDIATERTTNPTQPNLAQPNRHLQCPHCPKSFDRNFNLQRHLRVHTGERLFACDQCGKRFSQVANLTKHQLIHQNTKRFRCNECDKQFTLKHHLDTHLLTHSGERPFPCRHCEKSFTTSHHRNIHEQAMHLHVKPYRCKQCRHTATQRGHVIIHIRMVHFGLPRTTKQQQALNIVDDRDAREFVEKV